MFAYVRILLLIESYIFSKKRAQLRYPPCLGPFNGLYFDLPRLLLEMGEAQP